jgi:hypothetical protein
MPSTVTRPDLVNLPVLINPTDARTLFLVQQEGVNQSLTVPRARLLLGNMIGPVGPRGVQGATGIQGPAGSGGGGGSTLDFGSFTGPAGFALDLGSF